MGQRRAGRIAALQLLFQLDASATADALDEIIARHFSHIDPDATETVREHAADLCRKVVDNLTEIDKQIEAASENWRLARMGQVDRNLLRLAACELLFYQDVPAEVVVDEAIEIARAFGDTGSAAFVNGILDRIIRGIR